MNAEVLLIAVFFGAFLSPFMARVFRMPVPVGELIFGLILGFLLGQAEPPEIVNFLAHFGFLILMFLAGLEIDFDLLERTQVSSLALYTLYAILIFALALGTATLLGINPVVLLVVSFVSVGLMVATLKDMGMLSSPFAKRVLLIGVIGEVFSLFALTFMEKLGHFKDVKTLALDSGKVLIFFVGFFLFFRAVKLLLWWFPEIVKKLTYEEDPSAVSVRLSIALMFITSALAHLVGIESVLGAFLAGAMVSFFLRKKHDLEEKLSSIGYGFLIPIFFIKTGMEMEITALRPEILQSVGLLLVATVLIRLIPSPLLLFANFSPKELFLTSLFLSYPFTLMIAGAQIGRETGLIKESEFLVLFLGSALSSLVFPWTLKALVKVLR